MRYFAIPLLLISSMSLAGTVTVHRGGLVKVYPNCSGFLAYNDQTDKPMIVAICPEPPYEGEATGLPSIPVRLMLTTPSLGDKMDCELVSAAIGSGEFQAELFC